MRYAQVERKTGETDIRIDLTLEGSGRGEIATGIGFLDHMLQSFAVHGRFDLTVECRGGDLQVDPHHTVEDIGIALGNVFRQALGEKAGINRCGFFLFPMDEVLATVAVDLCGRFFLNLDWRPAEPQTGGFPAPLLPEFLRAFAANLGMVLHGTVAGGLTLHHQVEAVFKALGRSLRDACAVDPNLAGAIPSVKGVL